MIKVNTVRNRFTDDFNVWKVYLTKPIGRLWTKSRLRLGHNSLTKSINSSGPEPIVKCSKDAGVPQPDICPVGNCFYFICAQFTISYFVIFSTIFLQTNLRFWSSKSTVTALFNSSGCLLPTWSTAEATNMYLYPGGTGRKAVSCVIPDNKGRKDWSWEASEKNTGMVGIHLYDWHLSKAITIVC